MRSFRWLASAAVLPALMLLAQDRPLVAQDRPIVLKVGTAYDGKGKTIHNTTIVVEGSKILRIGGAVPPDAAVMT